jgi:hypothetical protein
MKRNTNSLLSAHYPESNFGGFSDVDGTVSFYLRVNSLLRPDSNILDFGCGRGYHLVVHLTADFSLHIPSLDQCPAES